MQEVALLDIRQAIHSNATITSSGSQVLSGYGSQQISLVVNVKASPTGTTPTITFTIQEVDPGDATTVFATSSSTQAITAIGVYTATLNTTTSGTIKVSWTVTGASASFTQVYATVSTKVTPTSQAIQTTPSSATTGIGFGRVLYGGSSGVLTAIRATAYTEQTTNFTGSVRSTSTNDTSAGTGARTMVITYYDQTGAGPFTESVTLNGTTAVNLVNTDHCYIEKMVVSTVGSTTSNQGTISLFTGAGATGTTVGSIGVGNTVPAGTVGDNSTLWAHHYTPLGKSSYIYVISGGTTGNQTANMFLRSDSVLEANAAEVTISDFLVTASGSSTASRSAANAIKVSGFGRIVMYVVSNGTNTNFFGSFDYADQ